MKTLIIITCLSLSIVFNAFSQGTDDPWLLSWPIFENTSGTSGVFNGYGDWCVRDEGPHPGLDFAAISGDSVIVPSDSNMISLGAKDFGDSCGGCAMAIAPLFEGNPPWWGWGLLHLDIENPSDSPFVAGSQLTPGQPLAPCLQYSWPGGPAPLHLHLAWVQCDIDPDPPYQDTVPIGPFYGYHNPFDYFFDDLSTYDEVQFKKVCHEGPNNTGIWFMPDGFETAAQFGQAPGSPSAFDFQDVVFNMVDIAVSPFSAYQGIFSRDSAGVYAVAYEIFRQDPITGIYSSAAPDTGNFAQRWLMEMRDELPYGDSDEYRALFADGSLLNGDTITTPHVIGENAYIVTNSGALDTSSWQHGWDNVWTTAADDDWTDGICRGAWNTFLANPGISGNPQFNSDAFFPDGMYAVEVTAVSHGSRQTGIDTLPRADLSNPGSPIKGVIVDNFIPSIEEVMVYNFDQMQGGGRAVVIYRETWNIDSTYSTRSRDSVARGYLSKCASDRLGIAVRYSEEMEPTSLGRFWVTGEWGDQTIYSSLTDRPRWLQPVEEIREGLGIDPAECWYCYETTGSLNYMELGYIGRLSLHMGNSSIPFWAQDLAGNDLDYDPSTVAAARNPDDGQFDTTFVEDEPYDTDSWGTPTYSALADSIFRGVIHQISITVMPGVSGELVGDCPYWCGFWIEREREELTDSILVDMVKPDATSITATIYGGGDSSAVHDRTLSSNSLHMNGQYAWFTWCTLNTEYIGKDSIQMIRKDFHATAIDCISDCDTLHYDLGFGFSWPTGRPPWTLCTALLIDTVYPDGSVDVLRHYGYYPDSFLVDTVHLELPTGMDNVTYAAEENTANSISYQRTVLEYSLDRVFPNPCYGSASISFSLAEQGPAEILVFDLSGHVVDRLIDDTMGAGSHSVVWDLKDGSNEAIPSGLYFIRIQSGDWTGTTRLIVAR